jgi:hypothetical protein
MYWFRFGPAPPWQLDDLHPTEPTKAPPVSRTWRGSLAETKAAATDRMRMQIETALGNTPRD